MNKEINVLSLFDGISCGRVSLNKSGIKVNNYFSSEIDNYALKISNKNWPQDETSRLGDINLWESWDIDFSKIDLVLAGAPCQAFSLLGYHKGFQDDRGNLFNIFADLLDRIKKENPSVKFLVENTVMKKEYSDFFSQRLGVEYIIINSNRLVPQGRKRLYWSNFIWSPIKYADDCLIDEITEEYFCPDCKEDYVECDCIGPNELENVLYSKCGLMGFRLPDEDSGYKDILEFDFNFKPATTRKGNPRPVVFTGEEFTCLTSSYYKGLRSDGRPCLAVKEGVFDEMRNKGEVRMLTPVECERLQGLEDNYTEGVSKTQRYKMIGNCWTVDVIAHLLNCLNK